MLAFPNGMPTVRNYNRPPVGVIRPVDIVVCESHGLYFWYFNNVLLYREECVQVTKMCLSHPYLRYSCLVSGKRPLTPSN